MILRARLLCARSRGLTASASGSATSSLTARSTWRTSGTRLSGSVRGARDAHKLDTGELLVHLGVVPAPRATPNDADLDHHKVTSLKIVILSV